MDIDELGRIVKNGFDKTASKEDVTLIRGDVSSLQTDVSSLQKDVKVINKRLERIEQRILEDHADRLKRIEDAIGLSVK